MPQWRTDPAPKYGPTEHFGDCDATGCSFTARMTCSSCGGEFCLGHRGHPGHDGDASAQSENETASEVGTDAEA